MTLIVGIIIGVAAMWLREWVLAKPSPLLQLPAAELRAMLERTEEAMRKTHAEWLRHRMLCNRDTSRETGDAYCQMLGEVVMLRDALRIVEAREVETPRQGVYR